MREETNPKCRHNPQKDQGVFSRILLYTFKRNRSDYLFFCAACGVALTWPKLYSSVFAKTGLFLFSFFVSYWLGTLMVEGTIGVVAALCGIFFIRFAICKAFSVLVLALGWWEKSDKMIDDEKQFAILESENGILKAASFLGICLAVLNIHRVRLAYLLLFLHVVGVLILAIRKKWVAVAIDLVFVVYSILALLLMHPYSVLFCTIDNVLVLITMVLLFLGLKKAYL